MSAHLGEEEGRVTVRNRLEKIEPACLLLKQQTPEMEKEQSEFILVWKRVLVFMRAAHTVSPPKGGTTVTTNIGFKLVFVVAPSGTRYSWLEFKRPVFKVIYIVQSSSFIELISLGLGVVVCMVYYLL